MYWNPIIISLCALLLIFLVWKESKRPNKLWLVARIVATVIAVFSLASIGLPVSFSRNTDFINSSAALILTEGYDKDSVEKIIRDYKNTKLLSADKSIRSFGARYISDIPSFVRDSLNNDAVHIFGYGLEKSDLDLLQRSSLTFHRGLVKNLINSAYWTQQITSGEEFVLQGRFYNTTKAGVKIILSGFDMNLDSVMIGAGIDSTFELSTFPKHVEKAVYTVTVIASGDTLESNFLPVEVQMPKPLRILVLAASPDFENKFLKNWLTQKGYSFALRTSISKNKFDKQYINLSVVGLDRITSALLDRFDIVIADVGELKRLPPADLATLRSSVENKGIGLVVKATGAETASAFYLQSFPLIEARDSIRHNFKLRIGLTDTTSLLTTQQPVYIKITAGTQSSIKDLQGRAVAASKMQGLGRVMVTTLADTYSWWLGGNNNDYTAYWSFVLKQVAKMPPLSEVWKYNGGLALVNKEIKVRLQTARTYGQAMQSGSHLLYPGQDYLLPYQTESRYWPTQSGWETLLSGDTARASWFIHERTHWRGLQASERSYWTNRYATIAQAKLTALRDVKVTKAIPKIYFLVIFILSSGFLWFEKKYRSGDVN